MTEQPTSRTQVSSHTRAARRLFALGMVLVLAFFGAFGWWAVGTRLNSAVISQGQFVVISNVKKVQPPIGGVVGELRVKEGQLVKEGEIVVTLDETVTQAGLQGILKKLDELRIRIARLEAERDGYRRLNLPTAALSRDTDAELIRQILTERSLYEARKASHSLRRQRLDERIAQLDQELLGQEAILKARGEQARITRSELASLRHLQKRNLVQLQRINAIERQAIDLEGEQGRLKATIAQTKGRKIETQMQLANLDDDLRVEVTKELREALAEVAQLEEKRIAAQDQLKRMVIRAPSTGYVHQLSVHTVGGVVTTAEPMMMIVPKNESLEIECKVLPHDVDQLHIDQDATIHLNAFNRRTMPALTGKVVRISADAVRDQQTGLTYFPVRVSLPADELAKLGDQKLTSGMQAEVFLRTGEKSPLDYFIGPLQDQIARALKER